MYSSSMRPVQRWRLLLLVELEWFGPCCRKRTLSPSFSTRLECRLVGQAGATQQSLHDGSGNASKLTRFFRLPTPPAI